MAGNAGPTSRRRPEDPPWVRRTLIGLAGLVLGVLIVLPVASVFLSALADGLIGYWRHVVLDPDTRHAIGLTLFVAAISVGANTLFGLAAAWAIARFRFPGRSLLVSMLDLPFAVSPVVAGLMLVLLFGKRGYLGETLVEQWNLHILFAWPGLVLATTFVTLPFVARELIPVMEALGPDEEVAAISLGANGWQTFYHVTLPNIKWALLYGIILCNARAMGEFGAVYVVSGRIAGLTDTLPLRIAKLFDEYETTASFACASLLTFVALGTLAAKTALERWTRADLAERLGAVAPPE